MSSAIALAAAFPDPRVEKTLDTIESVVKDKSNPIGKSSIDSLLKSTFEKILGLDCPGILFIVAPDSCPTSSGSISISIDSDSSKPASQTETKRTASPPTDDILTANSHVRERDLANLDDQEFAREIAAPYLGETGRQQVKKSTQETAELIKSNLESAREIQTIAADSQELTVTQDVMKSHAKVFSQLGDMAANQSRLESKVYLGVLSLQQQQASLMQLSANLSEGIDEANRHQRLDQDAIAIAAMRAGVYLPFRRLQSSNSK
ncbi:hypothetical protein B7486_49145 [cyanobacterium TDX16]|nr:hypothetical protein B7486_49145 [cyanobacterium TDX16]